MEHKESEGKRDNLLALILIAELSKRDRKKAEVGLGRRGIELNVQSGTQSFAATQSALWQHKVAKRGAATWEVTEGKRFPLSFLLDSACLYFDVDGPL